MKKTTESSRRRLALAHETLRKLSAVDLTRLGGGSGAIDTTKQGSFLARACTYEQTVCQGNGCAPATETCP